MSTCMSTCEETVKKVDEVQPWAERVRILTRLPKQKREDAIRAGMEASELMNFWCFAAGEFGVEDSRNLGRTEAVQYLLSCGLKRDDWCKARLLDAVATVAFSADHVFVQSYLDRLIEEAARAA